MNIPIKILILEDKPSDAKLIQYELKKMNLEYVSKITDSRAGFIHQLNEYKPELILSDYSLPQFTGIEALSIMSDISPETPFIIVTGNLDEETAVECIKLGAWDYVLKDNLIRLSSAISNALKLKKEKDKIKTAQDRLAKSEAKYFDLYDNAPDMFLSIDVKNAEIIDCNQTLLNELGYTKKELIGKSVFELYTPETSKHVRENISSEFLKTGLAKGNEIQIIRKNGEIIDILANTSTVRNKKGEILYTRSVWRDITERKMAENKLAYSEAQLQEAQKIAHLGSWDFDIVNKTVTWSDETYRIFNLDPKTITPTFELLKKHIHPEDRDDAIQAIKAAIYDKKPYDNEYRIIQKGGRVRFVHSIGSVTYDKNGKAIRIAGIIHDITKRKKTEKELAQTADIINMSSSGVFLWHNEDDWPIKHVSQNVFKILGYTDKEFLENQIRFMDIIHPDDFKRVLNELNNAKTNPKTNKFDHKPYRIIKKNDDIIWVENQTVLLRDSSHKTIYYQGVIHDVTDKIVASNKLEEQKNKYEALSKKYFKKNEDLKGALSAIEQSEEKYRSMLNSNTDAVIITSGNYRVEYMNPAAQKKFGVIEKSELCHGSLFGSDKKCEWCGFDKLLKNKITQQEIKNPTDERNYIVSYSRILNNDGTISLMSIYRDVTDLRKTERERLQLLDTLEASLNEIFIFDTETLKFQYVNEGTVKNLGYSIEELKNMTPTELATEFDSASLKRLMQPLINKEKKKIIFETLHKRKNGSLYPVEIHLQIISQEGEDFFLAVINDISDRTKKEETIQKLSIAINQSPVSVVITNKLGDIEFVNPKFTETTGYKLDDVIGNKPNILKSGKNTDEFYKELWRTIKKGNVWRGEFRNRKKNGSLYWEDAVIGPVKNSKGEITNFIGIREDITERKRIEEKLKIQTQQLQDIFDNVKDVLFSINLKTGKLLQISPSCKYIFGYSQKDFYKNPDLIMNVIHPDDKGFAKLSKNNFEKNKTLDLKYRIINANGEMRWVNNKITPRFDQSGELIRLDASISDITISQLLQVSLEQASNFNNKIIKTSGIGVLMFKQNGECISANENAAIIAGTTKFVLLTQNFKDNPLCLETGLIEDAQKCLATKTEIKKIRNIKNLKQEDIWIETHFSTYVVNNETQLLILIRDISKIKFAEREIKQKALELRNLIQTVNTPIFGIDINGRINGWNKAAKKITGYELTEVLNEEFAEKLFISEAKRIVRSIVVEAVMGYDVFERELMIRTKQGELIKIILNINTHRNIDGKVVGVICTGQDITELVNYRKKLEKKVKKRTKKLNKALKTEKDLSVLKSKFVSMASHEFRTPLAAISFAAGFVKKYWQKLEDNDRQKKLSKIENQVKHMTSLLDDVLTIGKIDAGQIKFNPQQIDFEEFINPIIDEVNNVTNNSHKIKLIKTYKLKQIYIDEKLGRNIFINLLSNAIKFSPGKDYIELSCCKNKGFLNFEIKDFGLGIKEEDMKCIFEPFRRGQNSDTIQGTGLGLAIVKESVIKHNGTIRVETKLGEGSTFVVCLPLHEKNTIEKN